MKKTVIHYLFVLLLISCNSEENSLQNLENSNQKMKSFFETIVAKTDGDKISLIVSQEELLESAKQSLKETDLELEPLSYEIFKDNNKNYLRIFSKNKYVTTIELVKVSNSTYATGKTSCTSIACASGGGCVPNGNYCTECKSPDPSTVGDCKRTTTNEFEHAR
ncbi:hypothetical protein [Flavobacterium sp. NRK F7]|uniref:hypothetical protein n=1 Tax=Flavobacterium sp. NRK F7 TaxID=2954930 RepID=UPI0020904373|nr:hypothetical protein [Flavobacterium sp. NRK F7]MCO6163304.1 hypothetical protein [Flavobacterium sp. NRK F7]